MHFPGIAPHKTAVRLILTKHQTYKQHKSLNGSRILNTSPSKLNLTPNDCKFDADLKKWSQIGPEIKINFGNPKKHNLKRPKISFLVLGDKIQLTAVLWGAIPGKCLWNDTQKTLVQMLLMIASKKSAIIPYP